MPEPVTDPTTDKDPDPKHVRVLRGLPEGTRSAQVVFKAESRLPGNRTVRRSAAEFAVLRRDTAEGYVEDRVSVADATRYLDAAHAAAAAVDAEVRRRSEAVDLDCPHCRRRRHYHGLQSVITGEPGMIAGLREMTVDALRLHLYLCHSCGSAAGFADGYLAHPLPGAVRSPA